ncbi:phosphoglycerate kinase, partial [Candidatus Gracilibacteria bacterium]|nr:phosphoglycerate kinase [Candidatus Gracilibacteria bacterium]
MKLKTIHEAKNFKGKRVLVRVDFNVPLRNGEVVDDSRIRASLPTIEFLQKANAKIILLSHLGRPKGKIVDELRLDPVAKKLGEILNMKIQKADECVGEEVEAEVKNLKEGEILLLENTRFHSAEKENDSEFVRQLAKLGDIFVNDAFGVAHRTHASSFGIAEFLPTAAGFLLEKEVSELTRVFENPAKPLVLVLGGAKIDTKVGVLKKFSELADSILLGGGIANTFLVAEGFEVGESLFEKEKVEIAREILDSANSHGCKFVLPKDAVCACEISNTTVTEKFSIEKIPADQKILDIGGNTTRQFSEIIKNAGTVVWNGPVGLFEIKLFECGTKAIAKACAETSATTILGGGDTIA